jgi:hypothetical protein
MFYIIVILAAIFAMPAKADETVKWRHVQHTASVQTLQVGDVNGHILGLFRLPGIAFFPDRSTGKTVVIGTSDSVPGSDGSMVFCFANPEDAEAFAKHFGGKRLATCSRR